MNASVSRKLMNPASSSYGPMLLGRHRHNSGNTPSSAIPIMRPAVFV
jgi:hypothetical protein